LNKNKNQLIIYCDAVAALLVTFSWRTSKIVWRQVQQWSHLYLLQVKIYNNAQNFTVDVHQLVTVN